MNQEKIFQAVAVVNIALLVPAVVGLECVWFTPTMLSGIMILARLVAAALVEVDHLSRF